MEEFPIFMGVTSQDKKEDVLVDMIFAKCVRCHCVQVRNLIPLEVLYKDSHNGSVGKIWLEHHRHFSEFILKHASGNVVELGGAHLILANHLEKSEKIKTITVYDTNITGAPDSEKVMTKECFFDHTTVIDTPDAIIHSHVIEHLYDPISEIKSMANLLTEGGKMIISAPLINNMLNDGFTNAMNFEHTYCLSKALLYAILANVGFEIIDECQFNKHCVFVSAQKNNKVQKVTNFINDPECFLNFVKQNKEQIRQIKDQINTNKENTFIFGAHIFTQFLLGFDLPETLFSKVLDNDPAKQNNRLYGTSLGVASPVILKGLESPLVVLKAAMYTEEIKRDILENINPSTRFIL
tara:strand:+ start:1147 stop:2202 length:1056 start_codon:yes stop_codon:yes gene_type:complete